MSTLFKGLLILLCLLRLPFAIIPILLKGFVPFFKQRLEFERLNLRNESARSFALDQMQADFCFEVSSEGELEQLRPFIDQTLAAGKKIEILFSSPSVESKLEKLAASKPQQVRIYRLPLLSFSPVPFWYFQNFWWWVTAPVVIFCRYDFFPELLLLKLLGKKMVLLSGATKKWNWYKQQALQMFSLVGAVTPAEAECFRSLTSAPVFFCDMRIPRINERFEKAKALLENHPDSIVRDYVHFLSGLSVSEKLIIGSAWPSDLSVLENAELLGLIQSQQLHLCIVPHKIGAEDLKTLRESLNKLAGRENVSLLSECRDLRQGIIILDKTGILCELYSFFAVAYVGGGYERSIHSVLEPYLSDAAVICGPKTHRSAEYDLIKENDPDQIAVLKNPLSFYTVYRDMLKTRGNLNRRREVLAAGQKGMQDIGNVINQL